MEKILLAFALFLCASCIHIPPTILNCKFVVPPPVGSAPPDHLYSCVPGSVALEYPFCNMSLPLDDRVEDLLNRLNVSDWVALLLNNNYPIPELGVVSYNYTCECDHAFFVDYNATVFPQVIGMSSSFNRTLWTIVGIDISDEIRGFNQDTISVDYKLFGGLHCLGPNINIARDPRWGRIQETPGEDPFLTGEYAKTYLTGIQGSPLDPNYDPKYIKVSSGLKHSDCYSVERGVSGGVPYRRESFNAIVTNTDLLETYLPAFKVGIEEGLATSIMCSFIAVNGVPACANSFILDAILRREYGFEGFVVEDKGALYSMQYNHNFTNSNITAAADAMKGGCDQDAQLCYAPGQGFFSNFIPKALSSSQITPGYVKNSARRILRSRFRVGVFDDPKQITYASLGMEQVRSQNHMDHAFEAALQSMVLLKNSNSMLPLTLNQSTVAVIGPAGNATFGLFGDYAGPTYPVVSIIDGLVELGVKASFEYGCAYEGNDTSGYAAAISLAKKSDIVIFAMGGTGFGKDITEGEFVDRSNISLPAIQENLLQQIMQVNPNAILVLVNGGQVAVDWEKEHVPAILEAFYPGQFGGKAVAHVLYGLYPVAGRLPYTVYPTNYTNEILMTDMNMKPAPGRTYKYYVGPTLYPFGYGLFYTTFQYAAVSSPEMSIKAGQSVSLLVNVTNTGSMASDVPVLAFFHPQPAPGYPLSQLFSFERIHLKVGESKTVKFFMNPSNMKIVQENGDEVVPPGNHRITVGGPENNVEFKLNVQGTFTVTDRTLLRKAAPFFAGSHPSWL